MAIYMEYDGIKGNVTAKGYEGMIALDSLVFGIHRNIRMKTGEVANREGSKPLFSIIVIEKRLDSASVGIFREAVAGCAGKQVKLHFVRTGKNQLQEYLTYTFEQCLPTFYQTVDTRSETSAAAERLHLSYSAIEVSFTDSGADNKTLSMQRHGYDLALAKNL